MLDSRCSPTWVNTNFAGEPRSPDRVPWLGTPRGSLVLDPDQNLKTTEKFAVLLRKLWSTSLVA